MLILSIVESTKSFIVSLNYKNAGPSKCRAVNMTLLILLVYFDRLSLKTNLS